MRILEDATIKIRLASADLIRTQNITDLNRIFWFVCFSFFKISPPKPLSDKRAFCFMHSLSYHCACPPGKVGTKQTVPATHAFSRLEAESVRLFDQPPVVPIDLYQRRLRAQPALIRQVASQTNDDARSMETQTEEVPQNVWIVAQFFP